MCLMSKLFARVSKSLGPVISLKIWIGVKVRVPQTITPQFGKRSSLASHARAERASYRVAAPPDIFR